MNVPVIASILIGLLALILIAVLLVARRKQGEAPIADYRALAVMGMVWVPVGVAIDNLGLWGVGLVFLIIGLVNRDKWKEQRAWSDLTSAERRTRLVVLAGLVLLLMIGLGAFFCTLNARWITRAE